MNLNFVINIDYAERSNLMNDETACFEVFSRVDYFL